MSTSRLERVEVVEDRVSGPGGGFLEVRRLVLRNAYDDGTVGPPYRYEVLERRALDAVAIAAYTRGPAGVHVWLRRCLRPPLLSRTREEVHTPLPWPEGEVTALELPAGLIDPGERGWEGVRRAGARELQEEAGIAVAPERIRTLGGPFLLAPGTLGEMVFPIAVEVPADTEATAGGGTGEVERGAEVIRLPLQEAILRLADAKSEIVLRRLRDTL